MLCRVDGLIKRCSRVVIRSACGVEGLLLGHLGGWGGCAVAFCGIRKGFLV